MRSGSPARVQDKMPHHFQGQKIKGQGHRGHIVAAFRTACFIYISLRLCFISF